jgi:type I restriction enzyme S subunit
VLPPVAKNAITDTAVKGSTLNKSSLGKLTFKVPADYHLQEKIARILQTIDQAIEKTEALIEKYQQIKAGLMHDLFTRGIGADGQLRPPREQAPELYQHTPIGWIPKEWEWATIEAIKDSLVDGPFGSNLKTEHYVSDPGVRVVRLQNIQSTKYNDEDRAFVSDKHANSLFRNKVTGNDILIAGLGEDRYPVGRACSYPNDLPPAINKADCFRLRCMDGVLVNGFVMYFLNTSSARFQVRKYEQGVTRPRINLGNMKKLVVPRPEINEQNAICSKLSALEIQIDSELLKQNKLKKQKSGLMHDLLTGKVQVNIDHPEAAHG